MAITLRTVDLKRSEGANSGRGGNDAAFCVIFGGTSLCRELEDFEAERAALLLSVDFFGEEPSEGSGTSWVRGIE